MGYHSDLGSQECDHICKKTGLPATSYGHLLDPTSHKTGRTLKVRPGRKYWNLTNPYGFLQYVMGSGDDFVCMDFAWVKNKTGLWYIIDGTVNSETGCFIDGFYYAVVPIEEAVSHAMNLTDAAVNWCCDNGLRHTLKGWNQDEYFFYRSVYLSVANKERKKLPIPDFTERQSRYGGARINRFCEL